MRCFCLSGFSERTPLIESECVYHRGRFVLLSNSEHMAKEGANKFLI